MHLDVFQFRYAGLRGLVTTPRGTSDPGLASDDPRGFIAMQCMCYNNRYMDSLSFIHEAKGLRKIQGNETLYPLVGNNQTT